MKEIFNIGKIQYEGPKSKNPLAFKFYNPTQMVLGKTMEEQKNNQQLQEETVQAPVTEEETPAAEIAAEEI